MKTKIEDLPEFVQSKRVPVWLANSGPDADVVISTRIRLARNITPHKFPARASVYEKKKIFKAVSEALVGASKRCGEFEVINFSRLKKLSQHFLVEERLASFDMLRGEGERGVAYCVRRSGKFSVMINEEDHLRLQGINSGFCTFDLWDTVSQADDDIGQSLPYAYNQRFGFLTSCPTNSGTGLRVSYLMHLPGLVLTKSIEPVLQGASQVGIATRGFFGEFSDVVGNFFQLSNMATTGAGEVEFIESTSKVIKEVIGHERAARERLLKQAPVEIGDKICRACGLLYSARMLSITELLNLTSAIRFGIECGVYTGHTVNAVNEIIMAAMPAHLQLHIVENNKDTYDDLDVARADVVRDMFGAKKTKKPAARKKSA